MCNKYESTLTLQVAPYYMGFALRNMQADIESLAEGSTGQTELSLQFPTNQL